ncbi:MAG TPA: TadE/TadG family type IV pilus assembly protein [Verrucomicrobiae bacterium]|nr:TadE/TadG family type IV pilus assembly protein [Verrucomicrobiae bacterium]
MRRLQFALRDERAAQLVEFAVALPLLVVFVVGIFDFSGAFTLKQKITNAARDAARAAAADPATDLGNSTTPVSVLDAFQTAVNYLTTNGLNSCGVTVASLAQQGSSLTWTATGSGCPPTSGLVSIAINRALPNAQSVGGTTTYLIQTQVTIQYAYAWHFNRVIALLSSGTTYGGIVTLTGTANALNEN